MTHATRTCSVEGCERAVSAKGYCPAHYQRWKRLGDPGRPEIHAPAAPCSVEGCDRKAAAYGYCDAHAKRVQRTGSPGAAEIGPPSEKKAPKPPVPRKVRQSMFNPAAECAEEGCERLNEYHCRGYCQPHYRLHLKAGTPCSVEGCSKPEHCKGYCQGHYVRFSRTGDPGPAELRARRRSGCLVEGCERKHFAQGYCRAHYQRWQKHGDAGGAEIEPRRHAAWSAGGAEGTCVECGQAKLAAEFYERDGRRVETCKECIRAQRKRWRDENPELLRERQVGYMLKFYFGMTRDEYDAMLAGQEGGCAICGKPPGKKRHHVDHDHETGAIRGILCSFCNTGLGLFGEDVALMERAATYLEAGT